MAAGQNEVLLLFSAPIPCPQPPEAVLTSDVLQRDGDGCRQLPRRAEGAVAQLLVGADACGMGSRGG